ncbi:hypothetical protein KR009_006065, partial [Drosophila setifemur]
STMPDDDAGISKQTFVAITMLILCMLMLLALPQWLMLCIFGTEFIWCSLIIFFIAFVLLTIIHMFEVMKYKRPWNYIVMFICYELLTLGVSGFLMNWKLVYTLGILSLSLLLLLIFMLVSVMFILIGIYPNPFKLAALAAMGFVLAFCLVVAGILKYWLYWKDLAASAFLVSVILVLVSHVLITSEHLDVLNRDDAVLMALVLYITYVLFLIGTRLA